MKAMIPTVPEKKISETENKQQYKNPRRPCGDFSACRKKGKKIKNRHAGGHAPPVVALTNCGIYCLLCTAPRCGCRCCGNAAMTYGRERRGVIQKRFGELFLDGKEGNRGKNAEQGFAAVIVFVPRERVDFSTRSNPRRPCGDFYCKTLILIGKFYFIN